MTRCKGFKGFIKDKDEKCPVNIGLTITACALLGYNDVVWYGMVWYGMVYAMRDINVCCATLLTELTD